MTVRLDELEADARYRRERLALYRARAYSGQPTTATRLRELERTSDQAEQRLQAARSRSRPDMPGPYEEGTS
jgi:hypothetical protein